ncbi:MAG: TRAP-type mannitol/chloroaromatic compound transport system permease small subunit [Saprospiraceae bacterium]|jgi:TRAP-type mannitol/chloroaromatic compound transport system permease small subunit
MNDFLKGVAHFVNQVNETVGRGVSWLTVVLVLLVCFDVTARYFFSASQVWMMELEGHLFSLIFLLGAGFALKHDRHVRVDLFYANFSEKDKAWTDLVGSVVFLIPWCVLIIYFSYQYAYASFLDGEGSANPGGLPARYLMKFAIVIGMSLLLLQAIGKVAENLCVILSEAEESDETV